MSPAPRMERTWTAAASSLAWTSAMRCSSSATRRAAAARAASSAASRSAAAASAAASASLRATTAASSRRAAAASAADFADSASSPSAAACAAASARVARASRPPRRCRSASCDGEGGGPDPSASVPPEPCRRWFPECDFRENSSSAGFADSGDFAAAGRAEGFRVVGTHRLVRCGRRPLRRRLLRRGRRGRELRGGGRRAVALSGEPGELGAEGGKLGSGGPARLAVRRRLALRPVRLGRRRRERRLEAADLGERQPLDRG